MSQCLFVRSLSESQIKDLHNLFSHEWWTNSRTLEETRQVVQNSTNLFGFVIPDDGKLIAFARVLSDYVFKALIFDVVVDPRYRGLHLGDALLEKIVTCEDLSQVAHFELYCLPALKPFYGRWEFNEEVGGVELMRRSGRR